MLVKQLSVFVENRPGRLSAIINLLAEHHVNLSALSLADTSQFGVLRLIADKPEEAIAALREEGIISKSTDVLAVAIDDTPGSLTKILDLLNGQNISVEYMYAFSAKQENKALMVFKVDALEAAEELLRENGFSAPEGSI
jgi:hypothetical protein